jgi:hypothetical protein
VAGGSTTTTLSSSLNPMNVGQSTTLTASVTGSGLGNTATQGRNNGSLYPDRSVGWQWLHLQLTLPFTTVGTHDLTAVYTGTPGNSSSSVLVETVNALPPP